jgi:hypothetical protein
VQYLKTTHSLGSNLNRPDKFSAFFLAIDYESSKVLAPAIAQVWGYIADECGEAGEEYPDPKLARLVQRRPYVIMLKNTQRADLKNRKPFVVGLKATEVWVVKHDTALELHKHPSGGAATSAASGGSYFGVDAAQGEGNRHGR